MTNVIFVSGEASPTVRQSPPNWQQIIWREWRNCDNADYADQLFRLVAGQPIDRWAIWGLVALITVPGILLSWLVGSIFFEQTLLILRLGLGIVIGLAVGGGAGYLFGRTLQAKGTTWTHWLNGFSFDAQLIDKNIPKFSESRIAFLCPRLTVGSALGSLAGIGQMVSTFNEQPNVMFGYVLVFGFFALLIARMFSLKSLFHLSYDLLLGLLLGVFVSYTLGAVFIEILPTYRIALFTGGLITGGLVGYGLGHKIGAITVLFWTLIFLILMGLVDFQPTSIGWLSGFIITAVTRGLDRMRPVYNNQVSFNAAYARRWWMFWWYKRPYVTEVAAALRHHAQGITWKQALGRLHTELQELKSPLVLFNYLGSPDWMGRFVAAHVLVRLGSEPVEALLELANKPNHRLTKTALWILESISHDTTTRLGDQADRLLCVDCLTYCGTYTEYVGKKSLTYHGCRTCGQSWEFILCQSRQVIAILDESWTEPYEEDHGIVRVNYLARKQLFDFNSVIISKASDEEIERFAVQVGNDTDSLRQPDYTHVSCYISSQCNLSENTLKILKRTFKEVEVVER